MEEPQVAECHVPVEDEIINETVQETPDVEDRAAELEACVQDTPTNEEDAGKESWTNYDLTSPPEVEQIASSEISPEKEDAPEDKLQQSTSRIRISVSNPRKQDEVSKLGIRSTFVSYLVQSETKLDDFPFSNRSVLRRFRDFDALHRLLRENHRGFVVPPLPSKNYLESKRGNEAFIKERQQDLNKFLCQIVLHPVLYTTEEMKVFLGCSEDLGFSHDWYQLEETAKLASGSGGKEKNDLDKPGEMMIKEFNSLMKKVGKTFKRDGTAATTCTITDTERTLQDMVPKLKRLETSLSDVTEKSEKFATLFQEVGEDLGLFGRILVTISRFEDESRESISELDSFGFDLTILAKVLLKSGYTCVRLQQASDKQAAVLKGTLEIMGEEANLLPAILRSLQDRTFALRSTYEAQGELETQRRALDALAVESSKKLGGMPGFTNKSAALSGEIKKLVEEVEKRSENYNLVTERNLTELERIEENRKNQFDALTLNVAKAQQDYCQTTSLMWVNLADEITTLLEKTNQ